MPAEEREAFSPSVVDCPDWASSAGGESLLGSVALRICGFVALG